MNEHLPEHPSTSTKEVPPAGASTEPTGHPRLGPDFGPGSKLMFQEHSTGAAFWGQTGPWTVEGILVPLEGDIHARVTFEERPGVFWLDERFWEPTVWNQVVTRASAPVKDTNPKTVYGEAKPPLGIVPGAALVECSLVMQLGNVKYGPANWRKDPVSFSTYFHALQRHAFRAWDGEDVDPESGRPHMAHVMANAAILLDAAACGTLIDDRPPAGVTAKVIEETTRQVKGVPTR